jgi:hypothetical protein
MTGYLSRVIGTVTGWDPEIDGPEQAANKEPRRITESSVVNGTIATG